MNLIKYYNLYLQYDVYKLCGCRGDNYKDGKKDKLTITSNDTAIRIKNPKVSRNYFFTMYHEIW